ncbi:putative Zinc metalloproteinase nas-4 [Hypsibius exemplaris]|uniref:Metalloendopeptidase n=1 Tax=Hypsibius exemplaris TaxID=2072580 RepID=A0A9X6RKW5_HYPEX|nr:putative Zinc metalloproteinase nas-4 [Hypsibius exemplaris]
MNGGSCRLSSAHRESIKALLQQQDGPLFEGDMIGIDPLMIPQSSDRVMHNGLRDERRHWHGGVVPFIWAEDYYTDHQRAQIRRAMDGIEHFTCVRFIESSRRTAKDFVYIFPGTGCFSDVGRKGRAQRLSLRLDCLSIGTIQHELMHVLGFLHEQSRSDRDDYIEIVTENIAKDREGLHDLEEDDRPSGRPSDRGRGMPERSSAWEPG